MSTKELQNLELPIYLTTAEVATLARVDASTVCRWRQRGEGPRVTWLSPTMPRYLWDDVQKWLKHAAA